MILLHDFIATECNSANWY